MLLGGEGKDGNRVKTVRHNINNTHRTDCIWILISFYYLVDTSTRVIFGNADRMHSSGRELAGKLCAADQRAGVTFNNIQTHT